MIAPRPKVKSVRFDDPYDHICHVEHTHEDTHLIYTQEQDMENNEVEKDECYEETNDYLITEEELKHIHPDLCQNVHLQQ